MHRFPTAPSTENTAPVHRTFLQFTSLSTSNPHGTARIFRLVVGGGPGTRMKGGRGDPALGPEGPEPAARAAAALPIGATDRAGADPAGRGWGYR